MTGLFGISKPILAMLHLKGEDPRDVLNRAMQETDILVSNGVDALVVENYFGSRADVETVLATLAAESCRCRTGSTSSTTAPPRSRWLTPTAPRSFRWTPSPVICPRTRIPVSPDPSRDLRAKSSAAAPRRRAVQITSRCCPKTRWTSTCTWPASAVMRSS